MANSWGTLSFEVPDFLKDVRDTINSVAEWLVTILDIALVALNFVKTFLVGFLDPLSALIQALLDELNALLQDLRQLGIYVTGDWNLLGEKSRDKLLGGYQEYERRMVARLTDRTDPSRPDVSGATTVLSMFFYTSVDLSEWDRLVRTVLGILAYFKQFPKLGSTQPATAITQVLYGASALELLHFNDIGSFFQTSATPPAVALVKWQIAPLIRGDQFLPSLTVPPGGFVVTVSTDPDGIQVVYDRPAANQTKKPVAGTSETAQPREYGAVRAPNGRPIVLHGGSEMLAPLPSDMTYNAGLRGGVPRDGAARVYGLLGSGRQPVPLDLLKDGDKHYFQRTFFVSTLATGLSYATGEYSILLKSEDMPRAAHIETSDSGELSIVDDGPATTLYVRVAACSMEVVDRGHFRYVARSGLKAVTGRPMEMTVDGDKASSDQVGDLCAPRQVVFANSHTKEYLETLSVALLVLVLTRPDLKPIDTLKGILPSKTITKLANNEVISDGVALQRSGLEAVQHLTGIVYSQSLTYAAAMRLRDQNPAEFRRDLLERIQVAVHDIYTKTGPQPDVEAFVVQQTKYLRSVTWRQILQAAHPTYLSAWGQGSILPATLLDSTLWGSLSLASLGQGLARNPINAVGNEQMGVEAIGNSAITEDRLPHMQEGVLQMDGRWRDSLVNIIPADSADAFLASCPRGLRQIYEKAPRNEFGDILVPDEWQSVFDEASSTGRLSGSADMSPVFYFGPSQANPVKVLYCRGLFARSDAVTLSTSQDGIFPQAALALRLAGAAIRRPLEDGEWLFVRWLDTMPGVEDFLSVLANWIEAVKAALQSIVDTIRKYIEFLEARIVELMQLIQRINALLQSILGFSFQIPKCSALVTISNGTGGVLTDLVTSINKPLDSPLAYGGGLAVVIPLFPSFALLDLLLEFWKPEAGPPDGVMGQDPSTVQGINGIPEVVPDPDIPDVL